MAALEPRRWRTTSETLLNVRHHVAALLIRHVIRITLRDKEPVLAADKALELWPDDPFALGARGEAELAARQFDEGIADIEAALAADGDQPMLRNALAWFRATGPQAYRD